MFTKFPRTITEDEINIEVDENCTDYPVDIYYKNILLADYFPTREEAVAAIPEIVNFYNNELWNDYKLLNLMVRYTCNIERYNKEGWKHRLDFNTPGTYEAFIIGIGISIRGYILSAINCKFASSYNRCSIETMQNRVFKEV